MMRYVYSVHFVSNCFLRMLLLLKSSIENLSYWRRILMSVLQYVYGIYMIDPKRHVEES